MRSSPSLPSISTSEERDPFFSSALKKHDVFISFRGKDTRNNFTSHLLAALRRYGIDAFSDEKTLERGDKIKKALLVAIQRSKISIIVFSTNYAFSWWCLDELRQIHESQKEDKQIVIPIFYHVDPSDVQRQQGTYGDAFKKHEEKFKDKGDTLERWKDALTELGSLAGFHVKGTRPESTLVDEIAQDVLEKLNRRLSRDDCDGLIGIEKHVENVKQLLRIGAKNVRIIGIWGMGGLGKTTIAEHVFHKFSCQFESSCFLEIGMEKLNKHGQLINLRNQLLDELLGRNNNSRTSYLPPLVQKRLRRKKVLIVLDDVNYLEQVDLLVGDRNWFHCESRIIITTRDAIVLNHINADEIYKVEELKYDEALKLFQMKAFKGKSPSRDLLKLSNEVVKFAGGIPLVIEILGSQFHSHNFDSINDWETILDYLKEVSSDDVVNMLRVTYDYGLDDKEKAIFLDLACFFEGQYRDFVENILNGCDYLATIRIKNLLDKSLIKINRNKIWMHDLVKEMGWKIVHQESKNPGERSRLWIAENVCSVLNNNEGTKQIEGIFLNMSQTDEDLHLNPNVFQNMSKLRLLKISRTSCATRVRVHLSQDLQSLPDRLTYFYWERCPLKYFPSKFKPRNLVELHMPYSTIKQLWDGVQDLNKLKMIDLSHSIHLTKIPDLSRAPSLERINLKFCTSLLQFPWHSLQNLGKLVDLDLSYCKKLCSPTDRIVGRTLKCLHLPGCSNFNTLPVISTTSLTYLDLSSTAIKHLPSSIDSLNNLSRLLLNDCKYLISIPSNMHKLDSLKYAELRGCSSLDTFPDLPRNIERIDLSKTAIKEVRSSSVEYCFSLRSITLQDCRRLESLPTNIFKLKSSYYDLHLDHCSNLKNLPEISEPVRSSCRLFLNGTGLRKLPSWIGNLIGTPILRLSGCENLEFVSESICHMNGLKELLLSNCSKLEHLPLTIGNFLSLTHLYLQDSNISEIPPGIKQLSTLLVLIINNCKKIQYLPELPFFLHILEATGCTSLEMVSAPDRLLTQAYIHPHKVYSVFYDCLKVNENGRHNIITEFQLRVLRMATVNFPSEVYDCVPTVSTCFHGDEIPNWFCYQSEGSSIHIKLPPKWHSANFLGFAVCAVASNYFSDYSLSRLCCDFDLKPNTGKGFQWVFDVNRNSVESLPVTSDSDHVFMWYLPSDYHHCLDAVEAKFNFFYQEYSRNGDASKSWQKIKRCGVRILYQLEQRAQPTINSDTEAPHPKRIKSF